jgi:sugar O-acyltransferase (sialic acid O-acetyltransferase NeuD family)
MPRKLLLFPCNGNAIEALDAVGSAYEVIGFVDDQEEKQKKGWNGLPVFGREAFTTFPDAFVLAVPGSPSSFRKRHQIIAELGIDPQRWATVIHPSASVSKYAVIGHNTLIMAGVVCTATSHVGNHVCILPNSVVHHDSQIGDYSLVGSGVVVAGYTSIGERCYIGSRTSIINNTTVGNGALIGIGSNVISAVPENAKFAGNPAKALIKS